MEAQDIRAHLKRTGWRHQSASDSYTSDMEFKTPTGVYTRPVRVKFNKLTLRIEVQSSAGYGWIRIGGASFDAITRVPDGRLQVVSMFLPAERRA